MDGQATKKPTLGGQRKPEEDAAPILREPEDIDAVSFT
jgi:hypothetical protein